MLNEEKVLLQLRTSLAITGFLLMLNTIAVLVSGFFCKFAELSFYMWVFITVMGWIFTIIQFKKMDLSVNWKKSSK